MKRRPYENSRLAQYVAKRVLELRSKKSQIEIAAEAGYANPNMVAMLKNGSSKLALDRVPAMARALDCDPGYLLRLALEQQEGQTAARALIECWGSPITKNELGWIEEIRDASDHSDPRMTARGRSALRAIFGR